MLVRLKYKYFGIRNIIFYFALKYYLYFKTINIRAKLSKVYLNQKIKKKEEKIVIFGSSKQINRLTDKEKSLISSCKIIYMNKNLIFWKHINIWPDYFFLSDTPLKSDKALIIFIDTLKKIIQTNLNPPTLLLEKFYKNSLPNNITNYSFKTKRVNLTWAKNLNQNLFGSHGSLTTLLNLMTVLSLGKKILLVGFDMKDTSYFFDNDKLFNKYIDKTFDNKTKMHPNAIKVNNTDIFTHWDVIKKNLDEKNVKIYCNHEKSLLVERGKVKFKSVENFMNEN